jgi:hypothetical protein
MPGHNLLWIDHLAEFTFAATLQQRLTTAKNTVPSITVEEKVIAFVRRE